MTRLDDTMRHIADEVEQGIDSLADEITSDVRANVASIPSIDAPQIWEVHRRVTVDGRLVQLGHLRNGRALPTACPQPDLEAAQLAANWDVPPSAVQHAFRIGHALSLQRWLDVAYELGLPSADYRECVQALTRFSIAYDEALIDLVLSEYERAQERLRNEQDHAQLREVRDLLEGRTDRPHRLDYNVELNHLGVVAWGPQADQAVRELAALLGRRLVRVRAETQLLLAWLGDSSVLDGEGMRTLRQFEPSGSGNLAIGTGQPGLDGFRRSHRQAGDAHVVGKRLGRQVTFYEDVALEALAMRNESLAREFVAEELGDLTADDKQSAGLRQTLRAYFDAAGNASSAAAALGIRDSTVTGRLRKVEAIIGSSVNSKRAELELALRLDRLL